MNYWLDLFTGTTWDEFRSAGSKVSGFQPRMSGLAGQIRPGDVLLCYLTGVMRWVGALEVVGPSKNRSRIWKDAEFPVRFDVKPLVELDPKHGVPMDDLLGRVDFFSSASLKGKFKGFIRRSPNLFKRLEDGQLVLQLLKAASSDPVVRPVDPKKLARRPLFKAEKRKGKTAVETVVSVPEREEEEEQLGAAQVDGAPITATTRHTEIQFHLLQLGAEMGLDVWVARNDRARTWGSGTLGTLPRMVQQLPTQFNEATNRTIELIDVLWLKGNSIIAAFEVECTTSIYSGLLRMSDLLALQPNLDIKLYLVAPDERRAKVEQELLRPTFALKEKPLARVCGFLAFSGLMEKLTGIQRLGLASSLKPEFLDQTAEFFHDGDADE